MPKEDIPSIEIILHLCIQQVTRFSIFREVIRQYGKGHGPREKPFQTQRYKFKLKNHLSNIGSCAGD